MEKCLSPSNSNINPHYNVENGALVETIAGGLDRRVDVADSKSGAFVTSRIYPLAVLPNFLASEELVEALSQTVVNRLQLRRRESDLYAFYQTGDLCSLQSPDDIVRIKEIITSEGLISLVEHIINGSSCLGGADDSSYTSLSRTQIDLSSQVYDRGDFLLTHDDRLDSRRVAFVLYLVDSTWAEEDGGALEFFPTDHNSLPFMPPSAQRFIPQRNALVFFKVTPDSHHRVAEVLAQDKRRISIAGWFHDASTAKSERAAAPSAGTLRESSPSPPAKRCKAIPTGEEDVVVFNENLLLLVPPTEGKACSPIAIAQDALSDPFRAMLASYIEEKERCQKGSKRVVKSDEAYWYSKEVGDCHWMRLMQQRKFTSSCMNILPSPANSEGSHPPLLWPVRPLLKRYRCGDYRQSKRTSLQPDLVQGGGQDEPLRLLFFLQQNKLVVTRGNVPIDLVQSESEYVDVIEMCFIR